MKKLVSIFVTLVLISALFCIPTNAASKVLLDCNFEDGKHPFMQVQGEVNIVEEKGNKIAKMIRNSEYYSSAGIDIDRTTDFDLSVRVRLDKCNDPQWNWVKLCFRAPDFNENDSYHMHLYDTRVEFAVKGGPGAKNEMNPVQTNESLPLRLKAWYTVEIFARGDKMTAYINGKKLLEMTANDFAEGGFVFASWSWDYSVDDIKITERAATDPVVPTFKAPNVDNTPTTSSKPTSTPENSQPTDSSEPTDDTSSDSTVGGDATDNNNSTDGSTDDNNSKPSNDDGGSPIKVIAIVAIVVLLVGGAVAVFFILKKMNAITATTNEKSSSEDKE